MCKMHCVNGSASQTSWTDHLDGPAGRTSSHIRRLTFQFVQCRSFRVRRRPCFVKYRVFTTDQFELKGWVDIYRICISASLVLAPTYQLRSMSVSRNFQSTSAPTLMSALTLFLPEGARTTALTFQVKLLLEGTRIPALPLRGHSLYRLHCGTAYNACNAPHGMPHYLHRHTPFKMRMPISCNLAH